ncbi:hypothetical protein AG1IA_07088 [Rhizoctonia solani AG-1 IA]|uniref:Uncharacterized protein n=1 Tax=Thanatephorus cucumeris (strain AG1-IA) TaxID=983506 RepID=L8WQ42_THACA|nr:hypothetical protein AG1IA_07088 [Rhizoctonia solani AG-1 IA]
MWALEKMFSANQDSRPATSCLCVCVCYTTVFSKFI